jgi:drug/metabolite transporter (DMT)-like permease
VQQRLGTVLCLTSAVAFGAMAVFGKLAYDDGVNVLTLLFVRFTLAAAALWCLLALMRSTPRATRRTLVAAFALGAVGYALQAGLFFGALERMDASLLALLLYTYPAIVTAAAIVLGRESPSRRRTVALLVSSGGLVLMLAGAGRGGIDGVAVIMGIGAALTYSAYILISHGVTANISPLSLSAIVTTGAAITFGLVGVAAGQLETGFGSQGWLWLGLMALISTVGAIVLFFAGLKRVGPSTAAILSSFEPLMTVALAFIVFGEEMNAVQMLGGVLVLSAVFVLHVRPAEAQPA